ncbi:unnamed protein product [Parajaminaea phylloscopi]
MGICGSAEAKDTSSPQASKSRELDKAIKEDERKQQKEVKLLLLGAGESGKSTVLKSMRLIHNIAFTPTERESFRRQVFLNITQGMKQVLEAMDELDHHLEHPEYSEYLALFLTLPDIGEGQPFPESYHQPLQLLWHDSAVQQTVKRGSEIALPDNLHYFFSDIDRFFGQSYIPSDSDILRCRNKTTGIIETIFPLNDRTYRIFDVGGQRSERKKWIHCFENVTAVLFIVALSGYDCCLVEDKESNQMQEALMLFDSICNSKWFVRTSMILFLNKVDIFEQKLAASPIKAHFPDYDVSDATDVDQAKAFFRTKFCRVNRSQSKEVYPSFTNATDPSLLKIVMASVTDIILTRSLRDNLL